MCSQRGFSAKQRAGLQFPTAVQLVCVKRICLLFLCCFTFVFPGVDPVRSQEQEVSLYNDLIVNDVRHLQQFENNSKFEHQHI